MRFLSFLKNKNPDKTSTAAGFVVSRSEANEKHRVFAKYTVSKANRH